MADPRTDEQVSRRLDLERYRAGDRSHLPIVERDVITTAAAALDDDLCGPRRRDLRLVPRMEG